METQEKELDSGFRRNDGSPSIILIRPQLGENIGAVARAMANFGLCDLRLVAPRDGWPNPAAEAMATGKAEGVLKSARVFADTPSAFADITRAYATTARPREMQKRVLAPAEAVREMIPPPVGGRSGGGLTCTEFTEDAPTPTFPLLGREKYAFVFGPERTGLENEDLSWCETIITIPTAEHASLNIAQSAVLLCYEWFIHTSRAQPRDPLPMDGDPSTTLRSAQDVSSAPLSHYESLFKQLEKYLDQSDFFKVAEKKPGMWNNIRTMMLRGRFTEQEIRTLHGIVRALAEGR